MLIDRNTRPATAQHDWTPDIIRSGQPRYLAIADAIAADLASGTLAEGDRLPPQRALAARLGLDFTTVARGYTEAQRRGLLVSTVGRGSFIRAPARAETRIQARPASRQRSIVDFSMNLPPEPTDPALLERMTIGFEEVGRDLVTHLRYQGFGGSGADKEAATSWLGRRAMVPSHDRIFVTPGAHPAMQAILATLARPGDVVLCESLTYPGLRTLAAQAGLRLVGLPADAEGIDPEALDEACRRLNPKLLYVNPTLLNPTTETISAPRRIALAEVAREHRLPILEDDAYGFIPLRGPAPFAALVPELTWHIAGLAKCLGAGLRVAYVVAPDARAALPFVAAARATSVMASPLTIALATRWIEDGTADAILRFIRVESRERQALASAILPAGSFLADPTGFHLWLKLPEPWTRSSFLGRVRLRGVGVVAADAFAVAAPVPEAVRVCLGGPADQEAVRDALEDMAHALGESPALASVYL